MAIDPIANGESGSSARSKLNKVVSQGSGFDDAPNNSILMKTGVDTQAPSVISQEGADVAINGQCAFNGFNLMVQQNLSLSADGSAIRLDDGIQSISALAAGTLLNADGTTGNNVVYNRSDRLETVVLETADESQSPLGDFSYHAPITTTRNILVLSLKVMSAVTGIRAVLRDASTASQTDGPVLWDSDSHYPNGLSFAGGGAFEDVDLMRSFTAVTGRFIYISFTQKTGGTGTLELRGTTTTIGSIGPQFFPALRQVTVSETLEQLALLSDITAASALMTQTVSHTATGVQNYGGELSGRLHILTNTVTAFDTLVGATFTDNGFFSIVNQNSVVVEFDISASAPSFGGSASGQAYDLPIGTTTLFYISGTTVYPIAQFGVSAGGASGDHPVTLIRDTPTIATLASLVSESVNSNTGLWIVANNQISTSDDNIDNTVMVRALRTGLLDANNDEISTTAVQKNSVKLQAGTIVRVFSSTDLRVVSTPTIRPAAARYPDISTTIVAGGILDLRANQVIYNIYRNRTAIFDINTTGFASVYLPSLQNTADLAYLNRNDVFCFRHAGTNGTVRVRTFQVNTIFSDGTSQIELSPGQTLCVSPAPSGFVWTIVALGQNTDIDVADIIMSDWYRDGANATAADNSVRLHHRQELVSGLVRDHIQSSSATGNPVSLEFQHRNVQDDIAWIQWWTTWDASVPALGTMLDEIKANIPTALSYIDSNINSGFDFSFEAPTSVLTVDSIAWISGNEVRYTLHSAFVSADFAVNHPITVQGATNGVHNGTFLIDSIGSTGSNVTLHVTNVGVTDGTNDEPSTSAFVGVPVYADVVFISDDLRQVNFNLYKDVARTDPWTSHNPDWFDHTVDNGSSVLAIGYNIDIETTGSQIALQDDAGDWFVVKGGPRQSVTRFDNRTSYVSSGVDLPVNFETIHIDTLGVATFFIPEYPDQLDVGESRVYNLYSYPINGDNDVTVAVGATGAGNFVTFDEGIIAIDILPGTTHQIELYNDGTNNGVRLLSPVSRTRNSARRFTTPSAASTSQIAPLPMSVIDIINLQDEDINSRFITVGTTIANNITMNADADYIFDASVEVLFNGTEGTGMLFVPVYLVPVINGTDRPEFAHTVSLIFSRNGQSGSSAPKFAHTLRCNFEWQGSTGDDLHFDLRFGTFPSGYSAADIQVHDWRYSATAQLNLN